MSAPDDDLPPHERPTAPELHDTEPPSALDPLEDLAHDFESVAGSLETTASVLRFVIGRLRQHAEEARAK